MKAGRRASHRQGKAAKGRVARGLARFANPRTIVILIAGLAATWASFALTTSTLLRSANPQLAARLMPFDGVALAQAAEQQLEASSADKAPRIAAQSLSALRLQALNPTALKVLGFLAIARGDEKAGRNLISQAQRQSRRNASVQLWLIEDAVRRGDIRDALVHYDFLLRTKKGHHDMLFPIFLGALREPAIRAELARYYHRDSIWIPQFAAYALANSKDLESLAALDLQSGGMANRDFARDQSVGLIDRLVRENRFGTARKVFLAMPGTNKSRLSDPSFDAADLDGQHGAIGWQTRTQADASSSIQRDGSGRLELLVSASPLTQAAIAAKVLYLQPGQYRIDMAFSELDAGSGGAVGAQIRCPALAGSKPLWVQQGNAKSVTADLVVPTGCDAQMLEIIVDGGEGDAGVSATVKSVIIRGE